ncbi:MAG: type II secretion system protein [Natronospirillum sp.]
MAVERQQQSGVTLIELIIAIVVLGIASVGVFSALSTTTVQAVDPWLKAQSLALAQSFMDEVISKPFYPEGSDPAFDEDASAPVDPCGEDEMPNLLADLALGNRDGLLTAICMYNDYDAIKQEEGITKAEDGAPVDGLNGYNVIITVETGPFDAPFDEPFDGIGVCILRIVVNAVDPSSATTQLVSYRTSYWEKCYEE